MTTPPRYAIYYTPLPGSKLERFGAHMLGYDASSGQTLPFPSGIEQKLADWRELTRDPRKYGFHATLKAPMALTTGKGENELLAACEKFASQARQIPMVKPAVASLDGFIAIVPAEPAVGLEQLASDCTSEFDLFRAALTPEDRARRNPSALTMRQRDHLDRWGYPYVMKDFRFHMTLTGIIPAERRENILRLLQERFSELNITALAIDGIAVFRQDGVGSQFKIIKHYPLHDGSPITSIKSMGPPGV